MRDDAEFLRSIIRQYHLDIVDLQNIRGLVGRHPWLSLGRVPEGLVQRTLFPLPHPHITAMTSWKPTPREPAKTKAELREMLAEAVRNTQPQTETKPLPKAKKGRR